MQEFSFSQYKDGVVRAACMTRRFCQRVEHLLQIQSRATDNLQNVGRCGLLLERFCQVLGALT